MTLTIAAAPEPWFSPPRVKLTVTSPGALTALQVNVFRTHEDGTTYRVLMPGGMRLGSLAAAYDYHMPYGVPVQYSATTSVDTTGFSPLTWVESTDTWLVPADDPTLAVSPAYVASIGDDTYDPRAGVFDILDGQSVSVSPDGDSAIKSSIDVAVDSGNGLAALRKLAGRGHAFLLNIPHKTGRDVTWRWVFATEITKTNKGTPQQAHGQPGYPYRNFVITYRLVAQPEIILTPVWTSRIAGDYWASRGATAADMGSYYYTAVDFGADTRKL